MKKDSDFEALAETELVWLPEYGMGYFPVSKCQEVYNEDYFDKYKQYTDTPMGVEITKKRIEFVKQYYTGPLVDIGIGCGNFVETRNKVELTGGFDVNEVGIKWLKERTWFVDPYTVKINAATFWDSLEHIHEPDWILNNISQWVFTSLPIFKDCEHLLRSKHFKKEEHCWYWTKEGLVRWMFGKGFSLAGVSRFETELGREDIETFAFKRI